jgi:hypothetical protein
LRALSRPAYHEIAGTSGDHTAWIFDDHLNTLNRAPPQVGEQSGQPLASRPALRQDQDERVGEAQASDEACI